VSLGAILGTMERDDLVSDNMINLMMWGEFTHV
jgi:hypothetical protein